MKLSNKISYVAHYCSLFIAYLYILAAAINDGFTGVYLAVPFVIFLLREIYKLRGSNLALTAIHLIFLLSMAWLANADRSTWEILYPAVGKTIVFDKDIKVYHNPYYPLKMDGLYFDDNQIKEKDSYILHKGENLTITRQFVVGNPEFGIDYILAVKLSDKGLEETFMNKKNKEINWNALDKAYKVLPTDTIYIGNGIDAYIPDKEKNEFTIDRGFALLDIILIYPILIPLWLLFWLLRRIA